jgi:hypothetical protein
MTWRFVLPLVHVLHEKAPDSNLRGGGLEVRMFFPKGVRFAM